MKVNLPLMIQDPMTIRTSTDPNMPRFEKIDVETTDDCRDFLDGPVTPKVAVLDFDPATGELLPGARLAENLVKGKARYDISEDIYSPGFIQVSVLGAILKTMRLFERPEVLGRPITWAFGAPQLLVIPRAGDWANAFYERSSHSLQFFSFTNPNDETQTVHTSLSRDIVAHETAHAIIDGIAPALYDAVTPQSLALHEALADLVALITAVGSYNLRHGVLDQTQGNIRDSTVFSSLAPEFGAALDREGGSSALRNLHNETALKPSMREPHELSTVLSGALYAVLLQLYDDVWQQENLDLTRAHYALSVAAIVFGRLVFRAIDFLPPGEVSFADYGRALVAAERSATGAVRPEIATLVDEFRKRGIIAKNSGLEVNRDGWDAVPRVDAQLLLQNESDAYEFVNENRALLNVPAGVPFRIAARYHTKKDSPPKAKAHVYKEELILKVSWDVTESHDFDPQFPNTRKVQCGTTFVVDWYTGAVETVLTADIAPQKAERDGMIEELYASGLLDHPAEMRAEERSAATVDVDVRSGSLRLSGAARLLHIAGRQS